MKKAYLTIGEYGKLVKDISSDIGSDEVTELRRLKFIVGDNYDKEEAFHRVSKLLLRTEQSVSQCYVMLTDLCNFRCTYCYLENVLKNPDKSLTGGATDQVIEAILRISGTKDQFRVIFFGGEPLMNRSAMFDIIRRLRAFDSEKFEFFLVTNGSLVTESVAKSLKEFAVRVGVSIDGWRDLDRLRVSVNGKETFHQALNALILLEKYGVETGISCTVSKENCKALEEVVDFFYELGIKSIGFNLILDRQGERYAVSDPKELAYYMFRAFKRATELGILEDRVGRRRGIPLFQENPKVYDCPAYGEQVFFSPDGRIGPCQAFYSTGMFQEQLTSSFDASSSVVFQEWLDMGGPFKSNVCMNCPAIGVCGGACPYDVYTKTGKLDFVDPYFCTFVNEILKYLLKYYYQVSLSRAALKRSPQISIPNS
jgi:uncharacterized protein